MSSLEKFEMVQMHRSELKKHPLNPRKITAEAKRRLKAGLERFGLVQPLVFNKHTGLLVGGHQRLSCLDDLHEGKEYSLNVAVVDVDEAKEKELIVFLNNTSSMGYWDDASVMSIVFDEDVSADALGFSGQEMDYFERLMKQREEESASSAYLQEIEDTYSALENSLEEKADEVKEDKMTRKERWESTVSNFFAPPPPQEGANAKKDEDLTPEEKASRMAFRETRESWKKKDPDEEIIIRVLFKSQDNCRKWLQKIGIPPETVVIHEKELGI